MGQLVTCPAAAAPAPAPAPAPELSPPILDLDWVALFTASGAYDFLTDGPAGDGTHTYAGYTIEVDRSSACTQLEVTANGLEYDQGAANYFAMGINLRGLAAPIDPAGPCHVVARLSSVSVTTATGGPQIGIQRHATFGTDTLGDGVVRYRRADATPDLYAVSYNGSTHDVEDHTVTSSGDVRMQYSLTALYGVVCRGDTGTATDPADWKTLGTFAKASHASAMGAFTGTFPGDTHVWARWGAAFESSGIFETFTAYGLEA